MMRKVFKRVVMASVAVLFIFGGIGPGFQQAFAASQAMSTNYKVFQKWGDNQYHLINSYNDYNTAVAYAKLYANTKILGTHTGSVTYPNQQGSGSVPTLPNVPSKANATAWIKQAMAITNTPSMYLNDLLIIAYYESGYNPNAINKWDINWIEGHPSKGLMQVIPSTFEKYRNKSLPDNIFDPVANTVAAINYLNARYHGIANDPGIKSLQNGHGYIGY
jgi:hypothetical protein